MSSRPYGLAPPGGRRPATSPRSWGPRRRLRPASSVARRPTDSGARRRRAPPSPTRPRSAAARPPSAEGGRVVPVDEGDGMVAVPRAARRRASRAAPVPVSRTKPRTAAFVTGVAASSNARQSTMWRGSSSAAPGRRLGAVAADHDGCRRGRRRSRVPTAPRPDRRRPGSRRSGRRAAGSIGRRAEQRSSPAPWM